MNKKENKLNICTCKRRDFTKLLLTGSLGLSFWLSSPLSAKADHKAKALVLSCIDFRFVDFEQNFLINSNLDHEFDWLSLAGASLALNDFPSHADTEVFWEQLALSYKLHHIEKVIILDHQDCGAYASKIDAKLSENPEKELQTHRQYLSQAKSIIKEKYSNLEVELYFVHLDGKVEEI
ncbi:MAG: carbonic anhydrase [Cyanobacteria bacterium]|nr:carbonic anhydrase [Cyanobacteria bacterium CG_2015-16_32_12]NCO78046.1 carbonic anhydrase [Cyanobacteria bacterium CG_2015-22_32_23]NCQ41770.1 carbonic anhydrase [Cyanobacteria bacterium CG_2015-04_32_10]NCS83715.1 carbonic anhydrase [Cyanobacteria bacterium CG_2015-02_32_10]